MGDPRPWRPFARYQRNASLMLTTEQCQPAISAPIMVTVNELRQYLLESRGIEPDILWRMSDREIIIASVQCPKCGKERVKDSAKIARLIELAQNAADFNARCEGAHGDPHLY